MDYSQKGCQIEIRFLPVPLADGKDNDTSSISGDNVDVPSDRNTNHSLVDYTSAFVDFSYRIFLWTRAPLIVVFPVLIMYLALTPLKITFYRYTARRIIFRLRPAFS